MYLKHAYKFVTYNMLKMTHIFGPKANSNHEIILIQYIHGYGLS